MTEEIKEIKEVEEIKTTKNIDDILKVMDKASDGFTYGVWVPSLDREIQFKERNCQNC